MTEQLTVPQEVTIVKNTALRLAFEVPIEDLWKAVSFEVYPLVDTLRTRPTKIIGQMVDANEMRIGIDNFLRADQPFLPGFQIDWASPDFVANPNESSLTTFDKMKIISANVRNARERKEYRLKEHYEKLYNGEGGSW